MKIAICTFTYSPEKNGVANVCKQQAAVISKLGHDVSVLTSKLHNKDFYPFDVIDGINVFRFDISGSGEVLSPISGNISLFRQHIKENDYDVIIIHCWQVWPVKVLVECSLSNTKLVFFSHGTSVNTIYDWRTAIHRLLWLPYRYFFMPKAFDFFDVFVHLSNKIDNDRFLDNSICPAHIVRKSISNCINHIDYRYKVKAKNSVFTILVVGAYSRLKNEIFVLKQLIKLNLPCRINFVGYQECIYSAKMHDIYSRYLKHCNFPKVEVFFNYNLNEDDILSLYDSCDVFISASKTECQPLVILQAMAYGIPFLSSDVGCVSELPGGLIYKNQYDFRKKLTLLYCDFHSNGTLLFELSQAGYKYSVEELSTEKYIGEIKDILTEMGV